MRNARNLVRHEFIGLECEIVRSSNPSQAGISGRVIDEGMRIMIVRTRDGDKKIEKKNSVFRFAVGGKKVEVDGNFIIARPEDRIKKKISRW
ncbi:MAG: ribonuclease P protein component 1 [Candidatus Aenigmarchaeota archaeon]|nr:ribonuclease P protein component 1 [Candidatus Aenigmarchaeota archaeon]